MVQYLLLSPNCPRRDFRNHYREVCNGPALTESCNDGNCQTGGFGIEPSAPSLAVTAAHHSANATIGKLGLSRYEVEDLFEGSLFSYRKQTLLEIKFHSIEIVFLNQIQLSDGVREPDMRFEA